MQLCCLLEKEEEVKKKQPKQSALYKRALFCFPFPPVKLQQYCIYSGAFFDRKAKGVKELDRFCLM